MGRFATLFATTLTILSAATIVSSAVGDVVPPNSVRVPLQSRLTPSRAVTASAVAETTVENSPVVSRLSPIFEPNHTPRIVTNGVVTPPGTKVGFTYYDFQTNASMANRVTYSEDGSDKYIQVIWMVSKDPTRDPATRIPGFNTARGSHYNYLDANLPDDLVAGIEDWKKIETERAGWPSLVQFDDGSVGTPSHTPVRFFRNAGIGDDAFFEFSQVTTTADSAVWPRAAVDGESNIHLIYNRSVPVDGNQLCYRRSVDGGSTWGAELFFTGPSAVLPDGVTGPLPSGAGGDTYAVAARGSTVVVAYLDGPLRVLARRSTDYGRTWTDGTTGISLIYDANHTFIDSTYYTNGGVDSIRLVSDTVVAPAAMVDVIIDADGRPHYAIGQCLTYILTKGNPNPTVANGRRGTIYSVGNDAFYQNLGLWYYPHGDSLIYTVGLAGGGNWDGNGSIVSRRAYTGSSRYPQLGIDETDNIYLAYTSVTTGDAMPMQVDTTGTWTTTEPDTLFDVDGLFGHIYLTHKLKNFPVWSVPVDVTPEGVNCLFATLCDDVKNKRMYIAYSASATPGDRVTNVELEAIPADIYVLAFNTDQLNMISSVSESDESGITIMVSPNPADDKAHIRISSVTGESMTVSVVSVDGQRIIQSVSPAAQNEWDVFLPTSQLASGTYLLVIEQNGSVTTHTLAVVH